MKAVVLTMYAEYLAGIVSNHDNYLPISGVMIWFLIQSMTAQDLLPREKRLKAWHEF